MTPANTTTDRESAAVELPAPTPWPLFAGLGVTLLFAGLVTHWIFTVLGAVLALRAATGWWREVLPVEHTERVPLVAPARRAAVVARPAPAPGVRGHRMRLPADVHPISAGLRGGLVGAAAMAAVACAVGWLVHGSVWYPVNLLAAVAVPSLARADTAQLAAFSATGLAVGTVVHLVVSVFVGLVYAAALPAFPGHPAFWGGLVAPLVWSGTLWATLGLVSPVLAARIDWLWFAVSQLAFGCATGLTVARVERVTTMQTLSLAERAGLETDDGEEGDS